MVLLGLLFGKLSGGHYSAEVSLGASGGLAAARVTAQFSECSLTDFAELMCAPLLGQLAYSARCISCCFTLL